MKQGQTLCWCVWCGTELVAGGYCYCLDIGCLCPACLPEYARVVFRSCLVAGMRLAELSAGYREAAGLLDIQISRLRRLRRGTADAQTRAVLANRLRKLCEARRQCRELALLCEHYYERGFYRYASDSFQGLAP
ncbi:MAG: hypothetical protein ACLSCT_07830 [Oscillospiraceae bacterium]